MGLHHSVKKYIEQEIRDYHDTKKMLEELKEEILDSSPAPPDGMPRGSGTSNPTESKAIRLTTGKAILAAERRLTSLEKVFNLIKRDETKWRLIDLYYFKRTHTPDGVMMELCISRRTFFNWRDEIINAVAIELGLI